MRTPRLPVSPTTESELQRQLAYLYDRRSTLDMVIYSLERYQRCRRESIDLPELHSDGASRLVSGLGR